MDRAPIHSAAARAGEMTTPPAVTLRSVRAAIRAAADPERAVGVARFFKTAPGQYGHGDKFLGIRVPELRRLVRAARGLPTADVLTLLESPWHEERLVALLLLVERHERGDDRLKSTIHRAYLAHRGRVNNWDLVDASA